MEGSTNEALIAGVLGAVGLAAVGGIALAATRRRRQDDKQLHDTVRESGNVLEDQAATLTQPDAREAALAARKSVSTPIIPAGSFAVATPVVAAPLVPVVAHNLSNGDPMPLPAEVPKTFEERDALLKNLVAAEPDRANPFTSIKARARRAKLIIQSLGQDFQSRKPRIDLSEYPNRWPALRNWQPATA